MACIGIDKVKKEQQPQNEIGTVYFTRNLIRYTNTCLAVSPSSEYLIYRSYFRTLSMISLSENNGGIFNAFFSKPKMGKSHGDRSVLYGGFSNKVHQFPLRKCLFQYCILCMFSVHCLYSPMHFAKSNSFCHLITNTAFNNNTALHFCARK